MEKQQPGWIKSLSSLGDIHSIFHPTEKTETFREIQSQEPHSCAVTESQTPQNQPLHEENNLFADNRVILQWIRYFHREIASKKYIRRAAIGKACQKASQKVSRRILSRKEQTVISILEQIVYSQLSLISSNHATKKSKINVQRLLRILWDGKPSLDLLLPFVNAVIIQKRKKMATLALFELEEPEWSNEETLDSLKEIVKVASETDPLLRPVEIRVFDSHGEIIPVRFPDHLISKGISLQQPSSDPEIPYSQEDEAVDYHLASLPGLESELDPIAEKDPLILGYTVAGSNTSVFELVINQVYNDDRSLEGKWGTTIIMGSKVLGRVVNVWVDNAQTSPDTFSGRMGIDNLVRGDSTPMDIIRPCDLKRAKLNVKASSPHLGNAPHSGTPVRLASAEDFDFFYLQNVAEPVRFARQIGSPWNPPFDVKFLATHHFYILAATRMGKGYLAAALTAALVGRPITAHSGRQVPLGIIYIDYNGQWATDCYGFFELLPPEKQPIVVNAEEIGVTTALDLVELIHRTYRLHVLSLHKEKISKIREILETRIKLGCTYQSLLLVLEEAVKTAYATNPLGQLTKIVNHIETEGGKSLWDSRIVPAVRNGPQTLMRIDSALARGRLVIIDLGDLNRENKPGFVYRLLKHVRNSAEECYNNSGRDEYSYGNVVIIDEAQNFVPEVGKQKGFPYEKECKRTIEAMAVEAGKYGLGLGLLSQRTAWTSKDVISNIHTHFIGKVLPNDASSAKAILGNSTDPSQIPRWRFIATGLACPLDSLEIRSLTPKELAKQLLGEKKVSTISLNEEDSK